MAIFPVSLPLIDLKIGKFTVKVKNSAQDKKAISGKFHQKDFIMFFEMKSRPSYLLKNNGDREVE